MKKKKENLAIVLLSTQQKLKKPKVTPLKKYRKIISYWNRKYLSSSQTNWSPELTNLTLSYAKKIYKGPINVTVKTNTLNIWTTNPNIKKFIYVYELVLTQKKKPKFFKNSCNHFM